jgi:recombinase
LRGQCRLIELGFRQGGSPGLGLRRCLVDQSSNVKGELARGEHKSIQTDRVILVPGPAEEIDTVRWIYRAFVEDGKIEREIAASLNERGILTDLGRAWTRGTVHQVLINEKYIGNNVWNRTSYKLKQQHMRNSPETWRRANGAFTPIVDHSLFAAARAIIEERSRRLTNDELLDILRRLLQANGYLSGLLIDESEADASSSAYRARFGSLLRAYRLIGFTPLRDYGYIEINRRLRRLHPEVLASIVAGIARSGGAAVMDEVTDLLTVNGEFTLSLVVARCCHTAAGSLRWQVRLDTGLLPDLTLAVRMDELNEQPLDYYLLPRLDMTLARLRLAHDNGVSLDSYRFDTLDGLYELTARIHLLEAAAPSWLASAAARRPIRRAPPWRRRTCAGTAPRPPRRRRRRSSSPSRPRSRRRRRRAPSRSEAPPHRSAVRVRGRAAAAGRRGWGRSRGPVRRAQRCGTRQGQPRRRRSSS